MTEDEGSEMTEEIEPFEFNVLIRQDPAEEKTKGGLILIDQERQKNMATKGTIVSVAPMAFDGIWPADKPAPAPGDRVLFMQHAGKLVDDGDLRLVKDKDILARIRVPA
jgi:co-chaperonin GroES (HSP10)